jgi:pyruvate/2-oxoglutarate dehydrogenase complex dihydrolipoamide acyltransferase (E2) component
LVRVVVPRYWVALLALGVFLGGIVVWSIFGTLENRVDGAGALIPGGSVVEMHVPVDSVLQSYAVSVGSQVTKGQTVATVLTPEGAAVSLDAPEAGQVSALSASSGEALQTGEVVALLASSTAPLEAVGALPAEDTNAVKVGDTVRVTPVGLNSSNLGTITGTVLSISTLPVSAAELGATLGSDSLAAALTGAGPVKTVTVSLQRSHKSGSVYSVSDAQGQSVQLQFGTAVQLQVVTSSQRPIDKVLK